MLKLVSVTVAALALANAAMATVYTDASGDVAVPGSPFPHIDILGMNVTNDATSISFRLTVAGDVTATDWGKFMIGIDSRPGGDAAGNGWGRPISMPSGMDTWLGGWTDSGNGLEDRQWNGTSWALVGATYNGTPGLSITKTAGSPSDVVFTASLAELGLIPGATIYFDAFTSGGGGGDGAVDSLAKPSPSILNWGDSYAYGIGTSNPVLQYTLVPAPASLGLLGVGGLVLGRRRRS